MIGFPLTENEAAVYIFASKTKMFLEDILKEHTDEELSKLVGNGIRNEFFDSYGANAKNAWENIPG